MALRWIAASAIGTSHTKSGLRLQDAYSVCEFPTGQLLAIVSDGAGSAQYGGQSAWLVCRLLKGFVREWFLHHSAIPPEDQILDWIDQIRDSIGVAATNRGSSSREFAATLAALIVTPDDTLALQIGDSAIAARNNGRWETLCWPENGEYASSTYFITDSPEVRLNYLPYPAHFDAYAVFSDGIVDIALDQQTQNAHPGFFEPMIKPVDNQQQHRKKILPTSVQLKAYLDSPPICERTDDDKTLILISNT